jgi:CheY-like chemotaxis protein
MALQTVLIVDDDAAIVQLLREALEVRGYGVLSAGDGVDAQALARQMQPHLILMDLLLPGMDDAELSKRLRADPATAAIPIVVISAVSAPGAPAIALPVDGHLPKPFRLAGLYATVARWARPV